MREVTSGLVNSEYNTKLKYFSLHCGMSETTAIAKHYFHKLLCNPASIESICNSNHALEKISGFCRSPLINQYLDLNADRDTTQSARNKVLK
jgi:hypothetical protein